MRFAQGGLEELAGGLSSVLWAWQEESEGRAQACVCMCAREGGKMPSDHFPSLLLTLPSARAKVCPASCACAGAVDW